MLDGTRVRLTVEGMRHEIIQYLSGKFSEMEDALPESIDRAIADFDMEGEIRRIVHEEMRSRIRSQVGRWGGEHRKKIEDAVKAAEDAWRKVAP